MTSIATKPKNALFLDKPASKPAGLVESKPKRVTYPSGLVVSRQTYANATDTIRIQVERIVSGINKAWNDGTMEVGSWSVSGSMLVDGESFESLPSRDFRTETVAKAFACGMFRQFEPMTRKAVQA